MIPWLPREPIFPPLDKALAEPNGLLAAGGDLTAERLIAAYRHGIFPWYSAGSPILWWSPDPRMVLIPAQFHISHSLGRILRRGAYEVRLDTAFHAVIHACATVPRAGQSGTWILPEMIAAYRKLHELGYAHSVEVWMDDQLAGGVYGVAIGRAFFGESMFSLRANASKIALAHLCRHLHQRNFGIMDCQMETAHLASLGARPIPRRQFIALLEECAAGAAAHGQWSADAAANPFRSHQA